MDWCVKMRNEPTIVFLSKAVVLRPQTASWAIFGLTIHFLLDTLSEIDLLFSIFYKENAASYLRMAIWNGLEVVLKKVHAPGSTVDTPLISTFV